MAWYALYKWFKPWRKTPYINLIQWYKKHLFDEWFESLSKEKQEEYIEAAKIRKERDRIRTENMFKALFRIYNEISSKSNYKW